MKREEKKQQAESLNAELKKAKHVILSSFQGLTVTQDTELRRKLAATGAKYRVVKNRMVERAAQDTPAAPVARELKGTTAIAYTEADPVALARVLTAYAKENPAFTFKAGVVEGRVVSLRELARIAALPPKENLVSQMIYLAGAPVGRLATVLAGLARNMAVVVQQALEEKKFQA